MSADLRAGSRAVRCFTATLVLVCASCRGPSADLVRPKDPLPAATTAVTLRKVDTCIELVEILEQATGTHFIFEMDVRLHLEGASVPLTHDLRVEPQDIWFVIESCLVAAGFALIARGSDPFLTFEILYFKEDRDLLQSPLARFIELEQLPAWSRHPAFLVRTVVSLTNVDGEALRGDMARFGLIELIGETRTSGATLVWITHFAPQVLALANEIMMIDKLP